MDKLLRSNWFVKLISLLIALMLYTVVAADKPSGPFGSGPGKGGGLDQQRELEHVQLHAKYNDEKYLISGLPETVTVQLQGSSGAVLKAYLAHNYETYVDLTGKGPGKYTVPVQYEGFPEGLTVNTFPSKVTVTIKKKETKTLPVQVDLLNQDEVADGREVGDPIISPSQVEVTGAKDEINRIAAVEGTVDVKKANNTIERTVPLKVYDKKGDVLDVATVPSVVNVKVPITGPSKTVPIQIKREGSLPDGLSIQSIDLEPHDVTLFGSQKVLDSLDFVNATLDLGDITKDTTVKLDVSIPKGVNKIAPKTVKAVIDVGKQSTKTLKNIPIKVIGQSDGLNISFLDPTDAQVDVKLKGTKEALKDIQSSDIEANIDVSGLSTGEQFSDIEISGLPENVKAEPKSKKAKIRITEGT